VFWACVGIAARCGLSSGANGGRWARGEHVFEPGAGGSMGGAERGDGAGRAAANQPSGSPALVSVGSSLAPRVSTRPTRPQPHRTPLGVHLIYGSDPSAVSVAPSRAPFSSTL
jgi:hypothetical protein